MHMSEIWHSKKNDCRLSRTQVITYLHNNECFEKMGCRALCRNLAFPSDKNSFIPEGLANGCFTHH